MEAGPLGRSPQAPSEDVVVTDHPVVMDIHLHQIVSPKGEGSTRGLRCAIWAVQFSVFSHQSSGVGSAQVMSMPADLQDYRARPRRISGTRLGVGLLTPGAGVAGTWARRVRSPGGSSGTGGQVVEPPRQLQVRRACPPCFFSFVAAQLRAPPLGLERSGEMGKRPERPTRGARRYFLLKRAALCFSLFLSSFFLFTASNGAGGTPDCRGSLLLPSRLGWRAGFLEGELIAG